MTQQVFEIRFLPLAPTDAPSNIQPAAAPVDFTENAVRPDCLSNRLRNASWTGNEGTTEVPANAISHGATFVAAFAYEADCTTKRFP